MSRILGIATEAALVGGVVLLGSDGASGRGFEVKEVAPGIYYGPAPQCEADYEQLQGLGIKTVLELQKSKPRRSAREQSQVTAHGMDYRLVRMGFHPAAEGTAEMALEILNDESLRPIFMHCVLGRDRAALVAALYRVRYLGWSYEAAHEVMQSERFNPFLFGLERYFRRYATEAPQ